MEYKIGDKVKLLRSGVNWNSAAGGKCPNDVHGNGLGIEEPFIGIVGNIREDQAIEIDGFGFSMSNIISIELFENTYEIY